MTGEACAAVQAVPEPLAGYGDLLAVGDMAEVLGVSARTVYRLADKGELPGLRVGHRLYFPKRALIVSLRLGGVGQ